MSESEREKTEREAREAANRKRILGAGAGNFPKHPKFKEGV